LIPSEFWVKVGEALYILSIGGAVAIFLYALLCGIAKVLGATRNAKD
jgi:hypothetical protein